VSECSEFTRVAAEWLLSRRLIEDMPGEAVNALAAGCDSPALRQLAGMDGASWSEIEAVLRRALAETGGPSTRAEAEALTADRWLRRLAAGELDRRAVRDTELLDILGRLGGDYDWFRLALLDLDVLESMEDDEGRAAALEDMRERARAVLDRPADERLAAPVLPPGERPFFQIERESQGVTHYAKRARS
jgi:hypothetical protein